jgi:predicted transcriptional regulator
MTTVKVPVELRDRIAAGARNRRLSQAAVITLALDALDRREFWASVQQGYDRLRADGEAWADYTRERDAWLAAPLMSSNQ